MHKILVHGCDIIEYFNLPIGLLSEEALEARHKDIRKHRLHHTRKISRKHTNIDLMQRLLLSSDPLISSYRTSTSKRTVGNMADIAKYIETTNTVETFTELGISTDIQFSDSDSEQSNESE